MRWVGKRIKFFAAHVHLDMWHYPACLIPLVSDLLKELPLGCGRTAPLPSTVNGFELNLSVSASPMHPRSGFLVPLQRQDPITFTPLDFYEVLGGNGNAVNGSSFGILKLITIGNHRGGVDVDGEIAVTPLLFWPVPHDIEVHLTSIPSVYLPRHADLKESVGVVGDHDLSKVFRFHDCPVRGQFSSQFVDLAVLATNDPNVPFVVADAQTAVNSIPFGAISLGDAPKDVDFCSQLIQKFFVCDCVAEKMFAELCD